MRIDEFFYFLRIDIFSSADNHILQASCNQESPVRVPTGKIPGMEPSVPVHGGRCRIGHFVIPLHDIVSAGTEFAVLAVGKFFAGFRINDLALNMRESITDSFCSELQGVGPCGHCTAG